MNPNDHFILSIAFSLITALSAGTLIFAFSKSGYKQYAKISLLFFLTWASIQGMLAYNGFYLNTTALPPHFIASLLPMILLIIWMLTGKQINVSLSLPLKTITIIHIIRIPVELVLLQLYHMGKVPGLMTFEGRNFDILSGITAPVIYFLAFRMEHINVKLLLIWNIAALGLLMNILINAILSIPTPFQKFAFDQPNIGVLMFPYIWLPAIIVPVVLYCHLVGIVKCVKIVQEERKVVLQSTKY